MLADLLQILIAVLVMLWSSIRKIRIIGYVDAILDHNDCSSLMADFALRTCLPGAKSEQ